MTVGRPFVSLPVGALDAARRAATLAAEGWGLPAPVLIRASMNATFACGDVVLRVGRTNAPAVLGVRLLERLAAHGIRVPTPWMEEPLSSEGLSITALRRLSPVARPIDWFEVGRMVSTLHRLSMGDLVPEHPLADPVALPWWDVGAVLADLESSDGFEGLADARSRQALRDAVERT